MKKIYYLILVLGYLTLAGCGQSGPLYLPAEKTPPATNQGHPVWGGP